MLATVGVWITLLWGGYSLVLLTDTDAITTAATGTPASAISRVYYAGSLKAPSMVPPVWHPP